MAQHPLLNNYLRPEGGRQHWWSWVLGLIAIIAIWFVLSLIIFFPFIINEIGMNEEGDLIGLAGFTLLLISFLPLILGIWLAQTKISGRPWRTLLTPYKRFRWRALFIAMIWGGLALIIAAFIMQFFTPQSHVEDNITSVDFTTSIDLYIKFACVILLLVPFQAASEEFLVRGYLNQAFAKYIPNIWIVFILSNLIFTSLHIFNIPIGPHTFLYLSIIFSIGFGMCILLYFEGGIESAIGLHIINNLIVFLVIAADTNSLNELTTTTGSTDEITIYAFTQTLLYMAIALPLIIKFNRKFQRRLPVE